MKLPVPIRTLLDRYRIDTGILIVFALLAAAAFAFVAIADEVTEGELHDIDRWLMLSLRDPADLSVPAGPAWLRAMMIDVTALGGWAVLTIVVIFAAGYLLAVRKYSTAAFVVAASVSGAIFGGLLKAFFDRSRPDIVAHLVEVNSASFPSGHAMHSAIIYLTLGALLAGTQKGRGVKIYLIGAAILLTLSIGFSRVYLGVHWPSDVIAGWSVGAAWAIACSLLAYFLRRSDTIDQPSEAPPGAETRS